MRIAESGAPSLSINYLLLSALYFHSYFWYHKGIFYFVFNVIKSFALLLSFNNSMKKNKNMQNVLLFGKLA